MNHPFIKMLRYEYKSNYMFWIFNLIIGAGLLTTLYFQINTHIPFPMFMFPVFGFLMWLFTLNSYQESTRNQSMQMYHLIPVSRNTKFFSKQFITLFAYPLVLIVTTAIFIGVIGIFITVPNIFHEFHSTPDIPDSVNATRINLSIVWLLGHSVSTFFAIIFNKNKILYAILVYFCFQSIMSIFLLVFFTGGKNPSIILSQNIAGSLLVAAAFYGLSYHLFSRRQL
jgi:hypothetical protein